MSSYIECEDQGTCTVCVLVASRRCMYIGTMDRTPISRLIFSVERSLYSLTVTLILDCRQLW